MQVKSMVRKALVCGAGGFIGHHLVRYLKTQGYWVRGADSKLPEYSPSSADEFLKLDLRKPEACLQAVSLTGDRFDEVYQLAADMGGMGFIHNAECEILYNSSLINLHMIESAVRSGVGNYFFASSACVYPDMSEQDPLVADESAYPAQPDNEYGWEKLYAERVALAYGRKYPINVRVARFQNCYGPEGTWTGGREKAPAALCRKVAEADPGGTVEVWGDGTAMRSYTFVDDLTEGIFKLMHSNIAAPVNIGSAEFVSVNELLATILEVSGKQVSVEYIDGPVGVAARNHLFEKISSLGWKADYSVLRGIRETYPWICEQVGLYRKSSEHVDMSAYPEGFPAVEVTGEH